MTRKNLYLYPLLYLFGVLVYLGVLNILMRFPSGLAAKGSGSVPGFGEAIPVGDQLNIAIFRYVFIPVFWSGIGDLTAIHLSFLLTLGVIIMVVARNRGLRR